MFLEELGFYDLGQSKKITDICLAETATVSDMLIKLSNLQNKTKCEICKLKKKKNLHKSIPSTNFKKKLLYFAINVFICTARRTFRSYNFEVVCQFR